MPDPHFRFSFHALLLIRQGKECRRYLRIAAPRRRRHHADISQHKVANDPVSQIIIQSETSHGSHDQRQQDHAQRNCRYDNSAGPSVPSQIGQGHGKGMKAAAILLCFLLFSLRYLFLPAAFHIPDRFDRRDASCYLPRFPAAQINGKSGKSRTEQENPGIAFQRDIHFRIDIRHAQHKRQKKLSDAKTSKQPNGNPRYRQHKRLPPYQSADLFFRCSNGL